LSDYIAQALYAGRHHLHGPPTHAFDAGATGVPQAVTSAAVATTTTTTTATIGDTAPEDLSNVAPPGFLARAARWWQRSAPFSLWPFRFVIECVRLAVRLAALLVRAVLRLFGRASSDRPVGGAMPGRMLFGPAHSFSTRRVVGLSGWLGELQARGSLFGPLEALLFGDAGESGAKHLESSDEAFARLDLFAELFELSGRDVGGAGGAASGMRGRERRAGIKATADAAEGPDMGPLLTTVATITVSPSALSCIPHPASLPCVSTIRMVAPLTL